MDAARRHVDSLALAILALWLYLFSSELFSKPTPPDWERALALAYCASGLFRHAIRHIREFDDSRTKPEPSSLYYACLILPIGALFAAISIPIPRESTTPLGLAFAAWICSWISRALAESFEQWGRLPLDDRLLHKAVEDRDHLSLSTILLHFSPNLESEPPDGIRVLARAAQRGDTESIALLLGKANSLARDRLGMNPLMWACKLGHQKAAMQLLDSSDPMALDARGRSAAEHAREARAPHFSQIIDAWQCSGRESLSLAHALGEPRPHLSKNCSERQPPRATHRL